MANVSATTAPAQAVPVQAQVQSQLHERADTATVQHGKAADGTVAMTEAHGGPAEHHESPPYFADPAVWVSLAMLALIGIFLWKKVPGMIGAGLDKKIADIRSQLDEATALRSEAEKLRGEYQAKMKAAEAEAAAMRARAEEEAEAILAKAKADTSDLIKRRQQMAEDRIGAAERAALVEVREKAARASTAAASLLIAEKHDRTADKSLVDKSIATLGNA